MGKYEMNYVIYRHNMSMTIKCEVKQKHLFQNIGHKFCCSVLLIFKVFKGTTNHYVIIVERNTRSVNTNHSYDQYFFYWFSFWFNTFKSCKQFKMGMSRENIASMEAKINEQMKICTWWYIHNTLSKQNLLVLNIIT